MKKLAELKGLLRLYWRDPVSQGRLTLHMLEGQLHFCSASAVSQPSEILRESFSMTQPSTLPPRHGCTMLSMFAKKNWHKVSNHLFCKMRLFMKVLIMGLHALSLLFRYLILLSLQESKYTLFVYLCNLHQSCLTVTAVFTSLGGKWIFTVPGDASLSTSDLHLEHYLNFLSAKLPLVS